jgi:nucleotide-binding universal stress UspA family protein
MANLKNILLTTDLSTNAIAAIPYAIALAKENGGTIHVFHVLEDEGSEAFASGIVIGVSAWIASVRKQHEAKVRDIAEQIEKDSGVKTIYCVASGIAAKEMVKYVRKFDIDMIVIATHGRTGLPHLILGSVAERVVRLSPVPVLTVRPGEHPAIENFSFQTILMPTDFSDNAAVARPLAVELAKQHHAKLLLAHVVEDSVYYASAAARERASTWNNG